MSKITIPTTSIEIGGTLQAWHYNKAMILSAVIKSEEGVNSIVQGLLDMSISEVAAILAESGEVEEYLMAIKAPIALLDTDVPIGLPNRTTLDGTATEVPKQFKNWLVPGGERWIKDTNDFIIFYTNPFAGNANSYLKGSEIKIINDISGAVDALTITQAEAETASGWNKLPLPE